MGLGKLFDPAQLRKAVAAKIRRAASKALIGLPPAAVTWGTPSRVSRLLYDVSDDVLPLRSPFLGVPRRWLPLVWDEALRAWGPAVFVEVRDVNLVWGPEMMPAWAAAPPGQLFQVTVQYAHQVLGWAVVVERRELLGAPVKYPSPWGAPTRHSFR